MAISFSRPSITKTPENLPDAPQNHVDSAKSGTVRHQNALKSVGRSRFPHPMSDLFWRDRKRLPRSMRVNTCNSHGVVYFVQINHDLQLCQNYIESDTIITKLHSNLSVRWYFSITSPAPKEMEHNKTPCLPLSVGSVQAMMHSADTIL